VDDHEAFRHVATDFLQRQYELTVVGAIGGGEEALAQAQDLGPQVIVIGLDMPGLETIPRLRKVLPSGADDLVRKTELTTDLLPAIRQVMQANRSR
jgi:DNA-binding NarL/FixJ family response regulator